MISVFKHLPSRRVAIPVISVAALLATAAIALAAVGQLTQLTGTGGCVSETGSGGACAAGKALNNVGSVAISPDGEFAYATGAVSDSLTVFDRDPATES